MVAKDRISFRKTELHLPK